MILGSSDIKLALGNEEVQKAFLGTTPVYKSSLFDAEVQYLQGTTATWIDTGIRDVLLDREDWNLYLKTDIGLGTSVSSARIKGHGYYDSKALFCGYTYQNARHLKIYTTNKRYSTSGLVEVNITCINGIMNATVNGSSVWANQTMASFTLPAFFLFAAANDSGTKNPNSVLTTLRLQKCRFSVKGTNYFDYTAVRAGNVGYFYDDVSQQLIAPQAGAFTLGPDIT